MARPAGPKEMLCLRLAKLDAYFDKDRPIIPGCVWEFVPPIQPGSLTQVKEFTQWLIRHRPIAYHGTNKHYSQGTFVIRKRKSDWGCFGFQLDFINCKVADEQFRAFWGFPVKADPDVKGSVTAPQTSEGSALDEVNSEPSEYDDSEMGSGLGWEEALTEIYEEISVNSRGTGYSCGRSSESEEIHKDRRWLETVACCEGTYSKGIVFGRYLYFLVLEDKFNLRWRGLKPGRQLTKTIALPIGENGIRELGAVKGFLYIVGTSKKLYVLRGGNKWTYVFTFDELCTLVVQDALVDEEGLPYKIMYFKYRSKPFGRDLLVWDRDSGLVTQVAPNIDLEVCKFLPYTGQRLGVGLVRDSCERVAVFCMDDGRVLAHGDEDYIFNYPGGEVVSFEVDGDWRVTLIGDSMKYGCSETISFPLHFEWELSAEGEMMDLQRNDAEGDNRESTAASRAA